MSALPKRGLTGKCCRDFCTQRLFCLIYYTTALNNCTIFSRIACFLISALEINKSTEMSQIIEIVLCDKENLIAIAQSLVK